MSWISDDVIGVTRRFVKKKNFCPKKFLVKIWEFYDKKYPKSRAYLGEFRAIFLMLPNHFGDFFRKNAPDGKISPKWQNFVQSGHTVCRHPAVQIATWEATG
jgi:hypothetical protein